MSKFDKVLKSFLNEDGPISFTTGDQTNLSKASDSGTASPVLNKLKDLVTSTGQPQSDGEKVLHTLATNSKITNIDDAFKNTQGIDINKAKTDLQKMGISMATAQQQQQQPQQKQQTTNPTSNTTQNPATTSTGNESSGESVGY